METIREQEFKKLCDDIYLERHQIYAFNPNMERREALLWMLAGCLVSLLSVPDTEQPGASDAATSDPYGDAVIELVLKSASPVFDAQIYLTELTEKLEAEI
jgi:hypothetical protein